MRGIPGAMTPRTHSGWVTTACWHIWAETLLWNSSTADRIRCWLACTSTTGTEPQVRDRTRDRPYGHRRGCSGFAAAKTFIDAPVDFVKHTINGTLEWFGDLGTFFWQVVRAAVTPPFEFRELFRQLDEIGSKSLPLVALAGAATGVVLSLEARYSLTRFGAKSLLPAAIVFSIIHETGPIITGLVVSGRVGAGIGAELASMKVTGQIDAIEASAVNPYR